MSTIDPFFWFQMGKMAGERKVLERLRYRNYIGIEYEVDNLVKRHNWDLEVILPPNVPLLDTRKL